MSGPQRKKLFKIEPFKQRVELDPNYSDKAWKILEHAIHEIYSHNASGLSFEELYRYRHFVVVFITTSFLFFLIQVRIVIIVRTRLNNFSPSFWILGVF